LQGRMRDVMAVAAQLLPGTPVGSDTGWWTQMMRRAKSLAQHTPQKDAQQIQFHYDVSDDFYALWLDSRRVYSCAYYREVEMSLAQAQEAKLDHICRKLMLQPGEKFLDIGAGWGGLLLWAAEHYGVDATGITLSKNQHAHVQQLIERKGLQGRVRMQLRDYRDLDGSATYDKIASVGMFEHVGVANYPAYFKTINQRLKPGGLYLHHSIALRSAAYERPRRKKSRAAVAIGRYIFPGGELDHLGMSIGNLERYGFEVHDVEGWREHYARTTRLWHDNLAANRAAAEREIGTVKTRLWVAYLAASSIGFARNSVGIFQTLASKRVRGSSGLAPTREELYR